MKQELEQDKNLLLKDLCARLPYETWVQYEGKEWLVTGYGHGRVSLLPSVFSSVGGPCPLIEEVKPYLRPMSSMAKEERKEIENIFLQATQEIFKDPIEIRASRFYDTPALDWFLKKQFDYRKLIEKGLALEAPEGMYKTE